MCKLFKSVFFCYPKRCGSPGIKPCWFSRHFGALLSGAGPMGRGAGCGAQTPCSSGSSSVFVRTLLMVGHCTTVQVFGETEFLPLLPISVRLFYPLLWSSSSASTQVLFRVNYLIYSYRFVISIGGGELRIFLHHHLELESGTKNSLLESVIPSPVPIFRSVKSLITCQNKGRWFGNFHIFNIYKTLGCVGKSCDPNPLCLQAKQRIFFYVHLSMSVHRKSSGGIHT